MDAFIDFDVSGTDEESKQLVAMRAACEQFVSAIHRDARPRRWLTLLGTSGAGKSMLMERINQWAKQHQENRLDPRNGSHETWRKHCGILKWNDCCQWMLKGDYGWVEQAKTDWLVIIDDIGVEYDKIRALAASKLYEICEARRGLWTGITGNFNVKEIGEKIDPRVASRLFRDGSTVLDVRVKDYNIRKYTHETHD